MNQLRNIFGLGKHESEAIMLDVTSKSYHKRLAQAFSGGDLEAANSKAAFLQKLCDELHFDPQRASQIHEGILLSFCSLLWPISLMTCKCHLDKIKKIVN